MTARMPATATALSRSDLPDRGFAAFLFDMDGTIVDSIAAAERVWTRWARRHGMDVTAFLPTIHGMRGVETVRRLNLPGVDAEDVSHGKPAPDCFVLAATRLGAAARASMVVITATHSHALATPHASLASYAGLSLRVDADGALRVMRAG